MPNQANLISIEYNTTQTFPANTGREYFFVVVLTGSVDIRFGGGSGEIPLGPLSHYEPTAIPTSEIVVTAAADTTYVVNTDIHPEVV